MPIYEYYCPQCEERFELLCSVGDDEVSCPQCGLKAERRFSSYHFTFSNPFPVSGNIAGDGEGFITKHMGKEEYKEHKQKIIS